MSNVRAGGIGVGVLLGLTLSALLMLMATAPSRAQTADGGCGDQFNQLRTDIETLHITAKKDKIETERTGLLNPVNDAETLASKGKTSDAVKKMSDFTVKVDQLEAAGRISDVDAKDLRTEAQATIDCLQGSTASE